MARCSMNCGRQAEFATDDGRPVCRPYFEKVVIKKRLREAMKPKGPQPRAWVHDRLANGTAGERLGELARSNWARGEVVLTDGREFETHRVVMVYDMADLQAPAATA